MTTIQSIQRFLDQKTLAVAGVSRKEMKFGNTLYKELTGKGLTVYPINPAMETCKGKVCYPNVAALPDGVTGLVIVTHPSQTLKLIREGELKGIRDFWVQQGAESQEAMEYAGSSESNIIFKECLMMFAQPVKSVCNVHRFFKRLFGRFPK
ncbi:MAG: CoA-binding protein [Bacteroidales bacterium]|nr:CoA-binding protein [Lentimicrobiaceae bacterium]MDD5694262.1 CoA-binding protein [Bacteroidales bacterium]